MRIPHICKKKILFCSILLPIMLFGLASMQLQASELPTDETLPSTQIGTLYITTESGSMDAIDNDVTHATKEKGTLKAMDPEGNVIYDGKLSGIKGRGNSTWVLPKKPYNITLENKADLFNMGEAKSWCLLANYYDDTLIRNTITFHLVADMGIDYCMSCYPVDLYLNGTYNGSYLLTEKVEVGTNRVDITDLEKATEKVNDEALKTYAKMGTNEFVYDTYKYVDIPNNPEDITGGYLLEVELDSRYAAEVSGFVTTRGQSVILKSPEYASKEQIEYISDYVQQLEDALHSIDGYNQLGKHYTDYIDVTSFAKMALLEEITMNHDAYLTSFYIYKDSDAIGDGKLHAGIPWDFDQAWERGNDDRLWDTNSTWVTGEYSPYYLAAAIADTKEVREEASRLWRSMMTKNIYVLLGKRQSSGALKSIDQYYEQIKESGNRDLALWNLYSDKTGIDKIKEYTLTRYFFIQEDMNKGNVFGHPLEVQNGWLHFDGKDYWYEDGELMGYDPENLAYRGKEIYDPDSDAWYWLDNVQKGAKATNKDVYQESAGGIWSENKVYLEDGTIDFENSIGKWVRYDTEGRMVKGWSMDGKYYFDPIYGTMAKGDVIIDNTEYHFDEETGILDSTNEDVVVNGWCEIDGQYYWYENGVRQGYDPENPAYRGKEIYDPDSDAWYWLDNVQNGAKTISKDVYQESSAGIWAENLVYLENGEIDPDSSYGKWVRYDENGNMIKGWHETPRGKYYFDLTYGTMAKGDVEIDGQKYSFDVNTGVLVSSPDDSISEADTIKLRSHSDRCSEPFTFPKY